MDEGGESRDVGGVENNNHVLDVGAVLLDEVAELGGNLAVALEQVFASHSVLTGAPPEEMMYFASLNAVSGSVVQLTFAPSNAQW